MKKLLTLLLSAFALYANATETFYVYKTTETFEGAYKPLVTEHSMTEPKVCEVLISEKMYGNEWGYGIMILKNNKAYSFFAEDKDIKRSQNTDVYYGVLLNEILGTGYEVAIGTATLQILKKNNKVASIHLTGKGFSVVLEKIVAEADVKMAEEQIQFQKDSMQSLIKGDWSFVWINCELMDFFKNQKRTNYDFDFILCGNGKLRLNQSFNTDENAKLLEEINSNYLADSHPYKKRYEYLNKTLVLETSHHIHIEWKYIRKAYSYSEKNQYISVKAKYNRKSDKWEYKLPKYEKKLDQLWSDGWYCWLIDRLSLCYFCSSYDDLISEDNWIPECYGGFSSEDRYTCNATSFRSDLISEIEKCLEQVNGNECEIRITPVIYRLHIRGDFGFRGRDCKYTTHSIESSEGIETGKCYHSDYLFFESTVVQ